MAAVDSPRLPAVGEVPFDAHVELLESFLARRDEIVERIQGLLNAQRRPTDDLQDGPLLSRLFEDCCFPAGGVTPGQSRLRGQLEAAHWACGFRPRAIPGLHNGLVDPAEMMIRAFHLWRQTRWPGRSGRVRYAHTLFALYLVRCLELLSMRVWDAGASGAGDRLARVQGLLDRLWTSSPAGQPMFVRDARWLIPLAQSPATDDLGAYFEVARRIAESLPMADRIDVHKAGVRLAAGHLRSQLRYYSLKKAVPLDDEGLAVSARTSNALDYALLIQELVPLLEAYERASQRGDSKTRLDLADAICQGISPDPELFVNRLDLLGAYSMIEHLFVTTGADGEAVYTPMGQRHVRLLGEYASRIPRVAAPLAEDCPRFRPAAGAYSPYGLLFGFSSDLIEHMALKATQPDAVTGFSLEDAFAAGDAATLAWVSGWRKLPHLTRDVQQLFDYPQPFAASVFDRIERALRARASAGESHAVVPTGRLFAMSADDREAGAQAAAIPDLPVRYIGSSDGQMVAARRAEFHDDARLSGDRAEGRCVVSYRTPGGWVTLTKGLLTEVLGAGRDAKVALPPAAAAVLKLMCGSLVVLPAAPGPST